MASSSPGPVLTLEPLIEAVRDGVETTGWALSGLQKTTSHQFEGRWEGDATRSAYLFFHDPASELPASVDVYLDETSRGLAGNLALVLDLSPLGALQPVPATLGRMAELAAATLPVSYRTPITLRFRLDDREQDTAAAETEVRFKLRMPATAFAAGPSAVSALSAATVKAFQSLLARAELQALLA